MNVRHLVERLVGGSSFSQPENFDKTDEGAGWVMYFGGNDWEMAPTAVIFSSRAGEADRLWVQLKFPSGLSPDADDVSFESPEHDKLKQHSDKARTTWLKLARKYRGNSPSWKTAFENALKDKEMQPYVEEMGKDKTRWMGAE
jgi:hypothetical protein